MKSSIDDQLGHQRFGFERGAAVGDAAGSGAVAGAAGWRPAVERFGHGVFLSAFLDHGFDLRGSTRFIMCVNR